jgi:short-subunit dehydrogenase
MSTKKIALITGASSGIGRELAKCFAINGYTIIIVARNGANLNNTAEEFRKQYGAEVLTIQADLSQPGAAQKVFDELEGKTIDVLVNNAGFGNYGTFVENDIQATIDVLRLNIENLTVLTRLVLPAMIDRRHGKILNVASLAAFAPGPLMAVYHATKAYVLSFSNAIRYELRGSGVTLTTLCPGPTATNFQKKSEYGKSRLVKMGMMSADDVARQAYQALIDGQATVVPGLRNQIIRIMVKLGPRAAVVRVVAKLNKTEA